MKRIKRITLALLIMLTTSSLFAQMNYWTTPAKKWNMSPSTPTSTALPGGASTYSVANGAYDENGDLLFYVQDMSVMDDTGSFVGFLPTKNAPDSDCHDALSEIGGEIAIVPIPGTCKQFYVIYSLYGHMSPSILVYVKVNCSSGSPVITYNGSVYVYCFEEWVSVDQPFIIDIPQSGSFNTAFAVSKVYTGTGATAKRFLLSVGTFGITRNEITSSGISSGSTTTYTTLGLNSSTDFSGIEAEISWGSNYFAWSSDNGKVFTIKLNPANGNYINLSTKTYSITGAKGIEFSNSTGNPYLYVAAASDIKRIYTYNQSVSSISWGSNDLSNTFLEYGKNNRIYGVSPVYSGGTLIGSKLVGLIGTYVLPGVTADIDSRYAISSIHIEGVFTLPDQIDGENYNYFNGTPAVNITNFTLNTNMVSNVCDNGTDKYCQNDTIKFNATYSGGTPAEHKFVIEAYGSNTCVPTKLTGAGYIDYQGSWISGTPTANLDLRGLTDSNGLNLGNIDGTVKITYAIKDACGKEDTYVRYINIYDPVPLSIDLEIKSDGSPNWVNSSHDINSPVPVGTYSLSYRVNNSSGTLSQLTVLIEEVNDTGAFIQTIYNKTVNANNLASLYDESLNSLCIGSFTCSGGTTPCSGGYTGYFACDNGANSYGNYYKITVTLSNLCGSSTDWSYFYVGSYTMPINPNAVARNKNQPEESITDDHTALTLYPNPVSNQLTIEFNNETDNVVEILLTDVLGKQTTTLMPSTTIKTGMFNQTFDVSKLPNGMYTYQIKLNNTIKTGMISKQ